MKKLLLSLALVASLTASAESKTENFAAAQDWFGITAKADAVADVKEVTSPETSIKYSYSNTYVSERNGVILLATANTASNPKADGFMTFSLSFNCAEITLKTGNSASTAAVVDVYAGDVKIQENLALNQQGTDFKVTVPEASQAAGTVYKIVNATEKRNAQFQSITYSSEVSGPVEPQEPEGFKFEKTTSIKSGETYVFLVEDKIAKGISATSSYGRMNLAAAVVYEGFVYSDEANTVTITEVDGKYTIMDANKRYLGVDATHNSTFQCYTEINDGCYYTASFEGETVKFVPALEGATDRVICQNGTYANLAPQAPGDTFKLPFLYKKVDGSGVEAVEAEVSEDAPAVYYNFQGQRVENPGQGLYIRVQGNKATKVVIR